MPEARRTTDPKEWKRGLPPGRFYDGMTDDYEVVFTVGGLQWHRRRTLEERAAHIAARVAKKE